MLLIALSAAAACLLILIIISLVLKVQVKKSTRQLEKINEELRFEINDRIKAQVNLAKSEAKARQIIDYAMDAIFFLQNGLITFYNPRTLDLLQCAETKIANIDFGDLLHPEDREKIIEALVELHGEQSSNISLSFRLACKKDAEVWVQLSAVPTQVEGEAALLCFMRDTTRERNLEQQIMQSQRMEAIGTLAGGIAHDFNNLLTGIQGHASLLLMDIDKDHPHYKDLSEIEHIVQSAGNLTKQLLGISRGSQYIVEPVNINLLLDETLSMFSRTRKEISITRSFDAGLLNILADKGQISQVFLNLFINASQAMPEGGDLTVTAKTIRLHEEFVRHHGAKAGQFVKVTVADTGHGMDEATRQRIFDPFFTTRSDSGGSGIGLSTSYAIIKNHGGIIIVESHKGIGTTFSLYLPATEEATSETKKKNDNTIIHGEGTILVVDDEESVLQTSQLLLKMVGYKILTAKTGLEALAIYKSKKSDIDLVLLDIIMPGMDGAEVFQALKEINPEVKVLLASGYSIESQAQKLLAQGCKGFIQKPFALDNLTVQIKKVLTEE